jgi:hypothetical protein
MAGCLKVLLIIAGILSLPSIVGPIVFWGLAYIISKQEDIDSNQRNVQSQALRQAEIQHRQLLQVTNPEAFKELIQREEAERVAKAKAQQEQRVARAKQLNVGLIIVGTSVVAFIFLVLIATLIGSVTATFHPLSTPARLTSDQTRDLPSSPNPEPTVRRAEPVVIATPISSPTPSNWAGYIPNPSNEQALAAFNDTQDQFGRPHADHLTYYAEDDSYHWIGPKFHKPMKMTRQDFDSEVWNAYYKKLHP